MAEKTTDKAQTGGVHNENTSSEVHSANSWEKAEFDDDSRKQKFLRLMGASKKAHHGRFVIGDTKANEQPRTDDKVKRVNDDLEKQYVDSIQKKVTGGRKLGLGFSEPEPEETPQNQEGAGNQTESGNEQRERDLQMRQSHQEQTRRDETGSYREQRDHSSRDREEYRHEGRHDRQREDRWNSHRDRRDDRHEDRNRYENQRDYRHSHHQGHQYNRDSRFSDRQNYGSQQRHQNAPDHQRSNVGHRPGLGQSTSQVSGPQDSASHNLDSSASAQPTDPKAKYQMSFVKSSD